MKKFLRWPALLVLAALIVAALVPAILSADHALKARASGGATISLSSATGQPGTIIQVSGQNFAPSEAISLYLGSASGTLLASTTTDASGNLPSTNITVPDLPSSAYGIVAVQGTVTASAPFSIVPVISLSRKVLFPGVAFTLTAKGFASQDFVYVYLDNTTGSSFAAFGCNANGDASVTLKLPSSNILQGQHTIIALGLSGNLTTQVTTTVLPHVFPLVGKPGMSVQLNGAAFTANETVSVYWGTAQGQLEGTPTTDANGNLSFSFSVPSGLSDGSYPVTVIRTHQKPSQVSTVFSIFPVTMSSTPGIHSGQIVKAHLTGFLPYESITISWNANGGQTLSYFNADQNGASSGSFIPPSAPLGSYTLTAIGSTSGLQATSSLNIGPGISGGFGDPGSTVTIYGGGFTANETVNVYFQTPKNGIVAVTTDATGAFTASLTVPSTYNPSTRYYVYAVSTTGTDHARAPFSFYPPAFYACDFSCSEVAYGQPITFTGNNFAIGEVVNIIWNYQQSGQFTIASTQAQYGNFTLYETVPSTPNQSSVIIAAIGQTSHITLTTSVLNDAGIYDNPTIGKAGATISVNGGSFGAGDTINLSLQGKAVGTATSNPNGTFSTTFKVPTITGAGNLTLTATDTATNTSASVPFQYMPVLTVSPTIVQDGDTITVTGKHFSAYSGVYLSLANNPYYGSVNTDANGSFTTTIVVSGLSSGTYYVVASATSNIFVSVAVVVQ